MKKNNLILGAVLFLIISLISLITFTPFGFTQSSLGIGTSASGGSNLGDEAQKYYDFADNFQKEALKDGLSSDERAIIFESIGEYERMILFKTLSNRQRGYLFKSITDYDKRTIFQTLNDIDKKNLFKIISNSDKQLILEALTDIEKKNLILSLPDTEKERWLAEYPDLQLEAVTSIEITELGEEAAEMSDIEKILSGRFPTEISRDLTQFGYDFFSIGSSSFFPETIVPVGPDYIIGPDDRFTINLWGRAEEAYPVTVSREGSITLPRLGTLDVGGLTFSELKTFLLHKFKEYYPDFEMSVTMRNLRSVEVFIIGELESPGTYSLTALSSVISALFASGGPTKNGSLRDVKVYNEGDLVKSIDLYEFFIKGTKGDDIRLKQGYTIFIPVIGPVVGIAGHIKRPAIYEMKGTQTIGDIIEYAGGVLPTGYLQNVVIERIAGHQRRVIKSFNLDPSDADSDINLNTQLNDGDLIKIYPVHENMEQVVYLEGHVKYPGEYELRQGMRLTDIISSFDDLLPEPYLVQAEIIRLVPPDLQPEIIEFNPQALFTGDINQNLHLQDQDKVIIYSVLEKSDLPEVSIYGALRNPGTYRLYKGMTIKDLIFQAGNLTQSAYIDIGDLTRIVANPGGTDIIKLNFSPQGAIEGLPEDNLELEENDQIYIREIPSYQQVLDQKVYLEGEFMFPGAYSFSEGDRLSSVIESAGGLTEDAYLMGAVFLRESVKETQQQRQAEYLSKLEEDILTLNSFAAERALDSADAAIIQKTLSAKQELIEKLRGMEPTGRMVIDISEALLMDSSESNVELRSGDRLIVQKIPFSINVMGEVYNPNALLFKEGEDVDYYLDYVGGLTDNADEKQGYIIKADGSVISKKQDKLGLFNWDYKNKRWRFGGGFYSTELDPGDTIIIPKKVSATPWLKNLSDVTSVIYEIAVSAGVVHEIFAE